MASIFHKNDMIKKNWRCLPFFLNLNLTRMHSSRMRTARALTVSPSMFCSGGRGVSAHRGCLLMGCLLPGGVCSRGCLLRGVSAPGGMSAPRGCLLWGVCSGGCLLPGSVCSQGDVCSQGGCLLPKGCIPACTEADTPPCEQNS